MKNHKRIHNCTLQIGHTPKNHSATYACDLVASLKILNLPFQYQSVCLMI